MMLNAKPANMNDPDISQHRKHLSEMPHTFSELDEKTHGRASGGMEATLKALDPSGFATPTSKEPSAAVKAAAEGLGELRRGALQP
jgi:hypothetical protein